MLGQLQDSVATQQALELREKFHSGDIGGIIDSLLLYRQDPSPLEAFGTPPSDSNAGRLLQSIKSALGIILILHVGLTQVPQVTITESQAQQLLNDPIFQKLREQVKSLSEATSFSPEELRLIMGQ